MKNKKTDENEYIKMLLRQAIEFVMPNLDHYRKPMHKGKIIESYSTEDGKYVCDVMLLSKDNSPDEGESPLVSVEIPVIWAGENRGIICPPAVGTLCDVYYYCGDPNSPRISNFRWQQGSLPKAQADELIIQQKDGVYVHIKANSDIELKTPAKLTADAAGGVDIVSAAPVTVKAAKVSIDGGSSVMGGIVTTQCICALTGLPHPEGSGDVEASK